MEGFMEWFSAQSTGTKIVLVLIAGSLLVSFFMGKGTSSNKSSSTSSSNTTSNTTNNTNNQS